MVDVSGVKRDVRSAREDPEIEFQVESVEKDTSAGVEERVAERAQSIILPVKLCHPWRKQALKNFKLMRPHPLFQFLRLLLYI